MGGGLNQNPPAVGGVLERMVHVGGEDEPLDPLDRGQGDEGPTPGALELLERGVTALHERIGDVHRVPTMTGRGEVGPP